MQAGGGSGGSEKLGEGGRTGCLHCVPPTSYCTLPPSTEVSGPLWAIALLWNSFSGIFRDERSSTPGAASLDGGLGPSLSDTDPQPMCPALCVELLSASRGRPRHAPSLPSSEVRAADGAKRVTDKTQPSVQGQPGSWRQPRVWDAETRSPGPAAA